MNIPNLSQNPQIIPTSSFNPSRSPKKSKNTQILFSIIIVLAIASGFWLSRLLPLGNSNSGILESITQKNVASTENISNADELVISQSYGDTGKTFTDTATGTLVKGGINGVGTHTLQREGGKSQYAALTSSTVDLDLFADKKVEIQGETNSSTKAGWFLDVGVIKILE